MAITVVGALSNRSTHFYDIMFTLPAGIQKGDLIITAIRAVGTVTAPAGYNHDFDNPELHVAFRIAQSAETGSIVWTVTPDTVLAGGVAVIRGVRNDTGSASKSGTDNTAEFQAGLTSGRYALYFEALGARVAFGNIGFSWPSTGFTSLFTQSNDPANISGGYRCALAYKIGSGPESPSTITMTSTSDPGDSYTWNTVAGYYIAKPVQQSVI